MKKRNDILPCILFVLLMALLFAPMAEEQFQLFQFKRLSGVYHKAPKPEFTFDNYQKGAWQKQAETYASENFGFRIPVIRMYNQYIFSLFHKSFSGEIAVGKDGWLYQKDGTLQYYGKMNQRYRRTNEEFEHDLAVETRSLVKIRAILREYGVELMTFTLPNKSLLYPEHLRPQRFVDTTFHADVYYNEQLTEAGFPHINMTPWFRELQKDYPFNLFYEKGSHWAAGAVLAADSLFRFMETLKGDHLAKINMGEPYLVPEQDINSKDRDLAELLNIVKIPKQREPLYEIPVTIEADSNTVYPSALFVGTSYYWYMTPRVPFEKVFSNRNLIFYDASYYKNEDQDIVELKSVNYLREVLTHDYVVYFKNAPQLYNDNFFFYGRTLVGLCISDERFDQKTREVADSLALYQPVDNWKDSDYYYLAKGKLLRNPELFEELRGTEVPTIRNPKLEKLLTERDIRNDREWAFLLQCKAKYDSLDVDKVFEIEASNVLNNKPLMRNDVFFTPYDYINLLMEETISSLRRQPDTKGSRKELREAALRQIDSLIDCNAYDHDSLMMMACAMSGIIQNLENSNSLEAIRKKAADRGLTVDKMFQNDVVWLYHNRDSNRFFNHERIKTLVENYPIEHKMWTNHDSTEAVRAKAKENNKPFVVAVDNDVTWIHNNHSK